MKFLFNFLLWAILGFSSLNIYAQCHLNVNTPLGSTVDVWDWRVDQYDLYIEQQGVNIEKTVDSPFFNNPDDPYNSPNTVHLSFIPVDFEPEDGWELLFKFFGTPTVFISQPKFALYNRYNGKIRMFQYVLNAVEGYQLANVEIKRGESYNYTSGVFSHFEPVANSLDQFSKGLEVSTYNIYLEDGLWVMTEFATAYDPCMCEYSSAIEFNTTLEKIEHLSFEIEGTGQSVPIVENQGAVSNDYFNLLGQTPDAFASGDKKGQLLFKSIQNAANFIGLFSDPPQTAKSIFPDWVKYGVPFGSAAMGVFDLFVGGGQSSGTPPIAYSNSFDLNGEGSINTSTSPEIFVLNTPGASLGNNTNPIPIYNNILGIANVLRTPTIYAAYAARSLDYNANQDGDYNSDEKVTFKLGSEIKYAINTIAGLSGSPQAEAALIFRSCINDDPPQVDGDFYNGLVRETIDEQTIFWRTPYMNLHCLEDYIVNFERYEESLLGEKPTSEGFFCFDDIDLRIIIRMDVTNNADEVNDPLFVATYNTHVVEAPYSYDESPENPFLDIPLQTNAISLQSILDNNIYAWEGININVNVAVTEELLAQLLFWGDNISIQGIDGRPINISDLSVKDIIRGTITVDRAPNCGYAAPMIQQEIDVFCATSYDPSIRAFSGNTDDTDNHPVFKKQVFIYPNPAKQILYVDFETTISEEISIELFNFIGQSLSLIFEGQLPKGGHKFNVNVQDLAIGTYYIRIKIGEQIHYRKFIKH